MLILGSLPGKRSLELVEYYAQPRNAFWKIMGALIGASPDLPYRTRLRKLTASRIALWDVCAAARRDGSLDASIEASSIIPNRFTAFLAAHPAIGLICFNGATAAALYRRLVLPTLPAALREIRTKSLPSTSPAHAAMPYAEKLALWSAAVRGTVKPTKTRRRRSG
jgi:hypoxanthine-DNA glycosylase